VGTWASLVKLPGLGPGDPGSNPGVPITQDLKTPISLKYYIIRKMVAKKKKIKASGRFGSGYGTRIRKKLNEIETSQRSKQKCPFCLKLQVKREAVGIWQCYKCGKKFTGPAYTLAKS
jgi:large subunit ribosomal protein L37Ae